MSSFDVRVFVIRRRPGRAVFEVRWRVAGRDRSRSFITRALADSYRAELVRAARKGAGFNPATGEPAAWAAPEPVTVTWYQHAAAYAEMKWPRLAPHSRASLADALATITPLLTREPGGRPPASRLRAALYGYAFNAQQRRSRTPEPRGLKHRPDGTIRVVPIPPVLVRMLRRHLSQFGTAPDGALFRGARGGMLSESVYGRVWRSARQAALGPELAATELARRPYDLRHAALSLWLNATGAPAEVAARAGNSARVLHDVYLHCTDGQEDLVSQRIEDALDADASSRPSPQCVKASGYTHRRSRPRPCPLYVREPIPGPAYSPRPTGPGNSRHHMQMPALIGVSAVQRASEPVSADVVGSPDPAHA